jgi:4-hydroxybenzoate polyprenyltransferase
MNYLLAIPRLLRLPNLVIVLLTQWIPYWLILRPAILKAGGVPVLTERTFGLLSANTVIVTMAGYVINDYFDRETDVLNRPDRAVVGSLVSTSVALLMYWFLLALSTFLSLQLFLELPGPRAYWPLWVFPAVSAGLFLYAWGLKCTPVVGNLFVAFLCGIVPVILLVPEDRPLWLASFQEPERVHQATGLVWLYALFAFFTNLLREQVKDLEDFTGDAACQCNTLAVVRGPRVARVHAGMTGLAATVLVLLLLYFWAETGAPYWQFGAGVAFLLLPTSVGSLVLFRANARKHFTIVSQLVKFVMIAGILLLARTWPADALDSLKQIASAVLAR